MEIYVTLKPTLRKKFLEWADFSIQSSLTSCSLWLRLLCWNGDRLTAGLLAVQKRPLFPLRLTLAVFPSNFHSHASRFPPLFSWAGPPPMWCISEKVFLSPPSPPSCVPECVWTGSPSLTRLEGKGECREIVQTSNPRGALLDWLTSYYFTPYSKPCTSR